MTRLMTVTMLMIFSMSAWSKVDVQITNDGMFDGGTIEVTGQKDLDDGVEVTITVTPKDSYTIKKGNIFVFSTISPSGPNAGTRTPEIAGTLTLYYNGSEKEDIKDDSVKRDYIFIVPKGFGAWVKEANFQISGKKEGGEQTRTTSPVEITTDGDMKLYLIQSYSNEVFYMRNNNRNNATTINTSNIVTTNSEFYFLDAGEFDEIQYYYIVHKGTGNKYVYLDGTAVKHGNAPAADANDDVKDNYRFKIVKNGSREAYNIIPKGGTKSLYKTDGNWNTADISLGDINNDLSCWNFVAKGNYTKTSPPFIISSLDGEKHYYKIQNNNNQALFMLPGGSNVYTYSSTADMNDMVWFFVKADIDDPYLDYYFIFHPKNNKYLRHKGTGDANTNAAELADYNSSDKNKFLFIVVPGTNANETHASTTNSTTYCIAPKNVMTTRVENTISLSTNSENGNVNNNNGQPIKSFKERNGNKGTHWNFISTTYTFACDPPTITYDEATNTVTMSHNDGATIYYTTDGSDPTVPISGTTTQIYSAGSTGFQPEEGVSTIKAVASKLADGGDKSNVTVQYIYLEITSSSEITDMNGVYRLATNFTSSATIGTTDAPFKGIIDGNFKAFSLNHALIGVAENATIKNLVISSATVSGSGNVGAIVNEAKGTTRIYNCGVQDGTVSGGTNVGGLVGLIHSGSKVRVVNCYNYANVSGSSNAAGIVGKNEGSVGNVRIALCMMYGDVTTATNISPVYTGSHVNNVKNFTEYNYYLYSTEKDAKGNRIEKIPYTAYNDQMAIDKEEYLTRFPFYRHILNTHRELAAYFLYDDHTKEHVDEIGHWVLKKDNNAPKYPVVEKWLSNTKRITEDIAANLPNTSADYAGKLLTTLGSSGYLTATVIINEKTYSDVRLPITDMDSLRYDFTWGKVVLPFVNEFSGWTEPASGSTNYGKICTGWKITKVGTSETSSVTNYNFADRDNPQKDIYDSNNPYIFAQGGNYIVPYNVSSITIEANFANAFYLSDPAYDMGYDANYNTATELGGFVPTTYHNKTVYTNLSTLVSALSSTTNPHVQAIVLVGNYHYNMKTLGSAILDVNKAVTIMSVDEDCNQEPDYGWYSYHTVSRPVVPALRFDFIPNIPMGMSSHVTGSTAYPGVSIWKVKGWFELTETCVSIMNQCEIDSSNFGDEDGKGNNRWIVNSGYFTQIVRSFSAACTKLSYIQIGGNAYVKELYPGNHSKKTFTNKAVPIVVTGGEIEECCMTGYHVGGKLEGNNIYFWCAGGRIQKFLGAETPVQPSGQTGGVNMNAQIDHARIWRFYGGGTTTAAEISGNINVTINNSFVDFYCGGPEFGDMVTGENGKTVTTNATGTTFRNYYGAGFGGTSLTYVFINENEGLAINNLSSNNGKTEFPEPFSFYTDRRLITDNDYGIGTAYKFEFINHSTGATLVPRWYIGRARFSLATTGNVINNLTGCIIENDFYGAGCQGKVNGTVKSTLTNCEIRGSAFGGGFKAANNEVKVYPTTEPTYSYYHCEMGIFSGFSTVEPGTWKWEQGNSVDYETYDEDKTELYTQSSIKLADLGNVTDEITLTINGGSVAHDVYGGGNESKSLDSTTVTLTGDLTVGGNVFGGGNKAEVQGGATVNIE